MSKYPVNDIEEAIIDYEKQTGTKINADRFELATHIYSYLKIHSQEDRQQNADLFSQFNEPESREKSKRIHKIGTGQIK
jgi:hypothetical protein